MINPEFVQNRLTHIISTHFIPYHPVSVHINPYQGVVRRFFLHGEISIDVQQAFPIGRRSWTKSMAPQNAEFACNELEVAPVIMTIMFAPPNTTCPGSTICEVCHGPRHRRGQPRTGMTIPGGLTMLFPRPGSGHALGRRKTSPSLCLRGFFPNQEPPPWARGGGKSPAADPEPQHPPVRPRSPRRKGRSMLVLLSMGSHLHIFTSSHLHIFTSPHLHIFSSSHLLIFTSSHPHIFTSAHLHILTSSHLLIFTSSHLHIFSSSHLHIFSSSHLLIFTSSHLHICFSSSHLLISTSSHLHIFSSCPLALLPSPSFLFLS